MKLVFHLFLKEDGVGYSYIFTMPLPYVSLFFCIFELYCEGYL